MTLTVGLLLTADAKGAKAEVYMNPVSAEIVKIKTKD